jgi:hypothetical protein
VEILLNEPICATVFPFQEPDDLSVAVGGLRAHSTQEAFDIWYGLFEAVSHGLCFVGDMMRLAMNATDESGTPILKVLECAVKLVEGADGEKLDEVHSS